MRKALFAALIPALIQALPHTACAQEPYRVLKTVTPGGPGGFDYIYADSVGRRLYVARSGKVDPRVTVFDLDTLAPVGRVAGVSGHGVAVDPASHHGFASSKPVAMWDTATGAMIKTIAIAGESDGILADAGRIYVFGGDAPNVSVIDAAGGAIVGTIALGADPEQAVSDGQGHLFVDLNDRNQVGEVDLKTLAVTARHDLGAGCGLPTGLALDAQNRVLFVGCRNPAAMMVLNADSGKILATLPLGMQNDGMVFNPATAEAFAATGDGHLTIVKETSPTAFAVEQVLETKAGARTITLDRKTGHIFLMSADYAPAPAGTVVKPGRIARGPMVPDSFTILEVGR